MGKERPRYIYITSDICKSQYVANEHRQLLRKVPIEEESSHIHHIYGSPYYVRLNEKHFRDIQFKLLNDQFSTKTLENNVNCLTVRQSIFCA